MRTEQSFLRANFVGAPSIVLDTNVVFDWLLFGNPDCAHLGRAIESGSIRWVATPAMCDEHFHVLRRGALDAWRPDLVALRSSWNRHCTLVDAVVPFGAASRLRCTDADDQKFLDLALGLGARWLLSKDRAVLKLGRRMRAFGVEVVPPSAWRSPGHV